MVCDHFRESPHVTIMDDFNLMLSIQKVKSNKASHPHVLVITKLEALSTF
jgi:hypothetical protein